MTKKTDNSQEDTRLCIGNISKDISYIQGDIGEIKENLKGLANIFASKIELIQIAKDTEYRLCILEKANGIMKYIIPIVCAIASSVITLLIISYLNNLG